MISMIEPITELAEVEPSQKTSIDIAQFHVTQLKTFWMEREYNCSGYYDIYVWTSEKLHWRHVIDFVQIKLALINEAI